MDWDEYFIRIADVVRLKSKDPSSKIGAVIVGPEKQIISTGYNGFPRGVNEGDNKWERPTKYDYVYHAETNAIYNAARHGISLRGSKLYLVGMGPPTVPCANCSKGVIQSGIIKVIGSSMKPLPEHWVNDIEKSLIMLKEGGIEFQEYKSLDEILKCQSQ